HAYILEQMAVQLKELANNPLQEKYRKEIADIDFHFSSETELTYENLNENLDEVKVTLKESEPGKGGVDAVDDVVINTEEPQKDESDFDADGIKQLLHNVWDVDKEKITILEEGGSS